MTNGPERDEGLTSAGLHGLDDLIRLIPGILSAGGAVAAAQEIEIKAAAISGPLGKTIATRSPRPTPRWLSAATVRVARARSPA